MTDTHVHIEGGDYIHGGRGSKEIKEGLRKIGVAPAIIRRAMVATYEAEMNVVIHAHQGTLRAAITPGALEVIIEDTGPGIPDVERAMREGFSTAPPKARELGFGAGMGLPNIRRNADRFSIDSVVGKGTTLRFSVFLTPEEGNRVSATALTVAPEACIRCLRCLEACPTQAIRLREKGPEILRHLCVDCTSCMVVCPQGVFDMDCTNQLPDLHEPTLAVIPDALLGQFGPSTSSQSIKTALSEMGWDHIVFSEDTEKALFKAATDYTQKNPQSACSIVPACPAILNLIQLRYPSLIQYVLPFLSPFEMIRDGLSEGHAVFIPSCPSQAALIRGSAALTRCVTLHPRALVKMVMPHVKRDDRAAPSEKDSYLFQTKLISGIKRVCQFLDKTERGQAEDAGLVVLFACDEGCFGSPVWDTPPALARLRSATSEQVETTGEPHVLYRLKPLAQRAGARLDADMTKAIKKLAEIDRISKQLPGRNCGVCGAPTCLTLAEDVVMDRASVECCIFMGKDLPDVTEGTKEKDR